jgi:hypothetical protein
MAPTEMPYVLAAEHRAFFDDFQVLIKKHPRSASRFALADVGQNASEPGTLSNRPPDWKCVSTEWGMICKPLSPEV